VSPGAPRRLLNKYRYRYSPHQNLTGRYLLPTVPTSSRHRQHSVFRACWQPRLATRLSLVCPTKFIQRQQFHSYTLDCKFSCEECHSSKYVSQQIYRHRPGQWSRTALTGCCMGALWTATLRYVHITFFTYTYLSWFYPLSFFAYILPIDWPAWHIIIMLNTNSLNCEMQTKTMVFDNLKSASFYLMP